MADLRGYYDPTVPADTGSSDVLPAGTYTVKIESSAWKDNSKRTGKYLQINMVVVEGDYAGAVVVDRLNLDNPSDKAERIAKGTLNAICEAVGVRDIKDSASLEGIRFQLGVKCEKYEYIDDSGKKAERMTNSVARYIKKGQTATTPQQTDSPKGRTAPNPDAPQADAHEAPPW